MFIRITLAGLALVLASCASTNSTPSEDPPEPAMREGSYKLQLIMLEYAAAEDVAKAIEEEMTFTPPSKVSPDARTNSLVVMATAEEMKEVRRIIAELDKAEQPPGQ